MIQNLTRGNPYRQITQVAFPLLLGNVLQQLYHTVDMLIVGRFVSQNAFASLGVCGSIMNLCIHILIGLCVGFSIVLATAYGVYDMEKFRKGVFASAVIGGAVCLVLSLVSTLFLSPILRLIFTPSEIMEDCKSYLSVILPFLIFSFIYNMLASILRAVGKTDITLYALILSMGLNIALDLYFVAVLKLGIVGAGIATVLSQFASCVYCFCYLRFKHPELLPKRKDFVFDRRIFCNSTEYGSISSLQQSSLYIGKLLIQSAVNGMGISAVTAFTASSTIESFILSFGDSGAGAISIFVAQNNGASLKSRVKEGLYKGAFLLFGTGVLLVALTLLFKNDLLKLLILEDGTALSYANEYLFWMAIFFLCSFFGNAFQGFFRGVGKINFAFITTTAQIACRVVFTYCLPSEWKLLSVSTATGIGWGVMLFIQFSLLLFLRKKNVFA